MLQFMVIPLYVATPIVQRELPKYEAWSFPQILYHSHTCDVPFWGIVILIRMIMELNIFPQVYALLIIALASEQIP